jgi:hypothetical protein
MEVFDAKDGGNFDLRNELGVLRLERVYVDNGGWLSWSEIGGFLGVWYAKCLLRESCASLLGPKDSWLGRGNSAER